MPRPPPQRAAAFQAPMKFFANACPICRQIFAGHSMRRKLKSTNACATAIVLPPPRILDQVVKSVSEPGRVMGRHENGRAMPCFPKARDVGENQCAAA